MFKFNLRNTNTRCEICSKLTIKTPERSHWCHSGVFINFEHVSHLVLVVSIVNFEQVNASWTSFPEMFTQKSVLTVILLVNCAQKSKRFREALNLTEKLKLMIQYFIFQNTKYLAVAKFKGIRHRKKLLMNDEHGC